MDAKGEQTAFAYTTYIQETPERVWQGLTDPALMKRYWRHRKAGTKTFHATAATWRAEARSKVAFHIEDVGHGVVKLTVTHDGFAPGTAMLPAISDGWPAVLASLKTLLETGSPLRTS